MTFFLMAVGVVLVGVTVWLAVRVLVMPRVAVEDHLRSIESYGFAARTRGRGANPDGRRTSILNPVAMLLGGLLLKVAPRLPAVTSKDLSAAGYYEITPQAVHGYRAMATLFLPGLLLLMALAGGGLSMFVTLLILASAALTWEGPAVLIRGRGRSRLDKIDRALPQFIDLVVATVEAGISFGGALNGSAARLSGPLGEELRLALQQQNLGLSMERALGDMLDRVETPSVRAFVRAVNRAEAHGVSIGPMMRHLAHDIRQRRRDVAREKIQKAPIKLMFPLVLFILPALLLVIMFPALYNLMHMLKSV